MPFVVRRWKARATNGRPVKLQWMREDEFAWEPYGSAMVNKAKATVDDEGNVLDWSMDIYSTPHGTRPGGKAGNLLSARYLETPFEQPKPADGGPPNYSAARNGIALCSRTRWKACASSTTPGPSSK